MDLRERALRVLCLGDVDEKLAGALALQAQAATLPIAIAASITPPRALPGLPTRPALLPPTQVPRRSPASVEGRAALVHAIAHIEFNAVNLALDAVWRFPGMPEAYYRDWTRVAAEEAHHFALLRTHLRTFLAHDYGDFPAHQGLWSMCEQTGGDIVARMALVPRTLEARGLDATPLIQRKLRAVGTPDALDAVAILDLILREEIGHVAIGNHWYHWLCTQRSLEPLAHYQRLARHYRAPRAKPPLNGAARRAAGFTDAELHWLAGH
ncbi:MAG: ferritin-like domain-containing protein [Comamonadaceae bacterium]|nr:ferritin-like domain-containing protein [Comamonadaceae bacterium]